MLLDLEEKTRVLVEDIVERSAIGISGKRSGKAKTVRKLA